MSDLETRAQVIDKFVAALERLHKADERGPLAKLKRCAGRTLAECRAVYPLFYGVLPREVANDRYLCEDQFFLIATLFPLAPVSHGGNLGHSLRELANRDPHSEAGLGRRLGVLLESEAEELTFRLRQVIVRLASAEVGINWRQLLRDLIEWDHPSRSVQKRWAGSFFGAGSPT